MLSFPGHKFSVHLPDVFLSFSVHGCKNKGLVQLAGGWWLTLICCERKILLAGRWLVAGAELM
jgi:hypothetical protein